MDPDTRNQIYSEEGVDVPDSGAQCFEQPLNERIRSFLRLEHLFALLRYHEGDESVWGRRAAMSALLDILTILARHDLRNEVGKALSSYHAQLKRLSSREDIDIEHLDSVLANLDNLGREIQNIPPQFASYQLRDNELLNNLNNRHAIPGGTCGFDMPSYQHWLSRSQHKIQRDIAHWCRHVVPLENAINSLLQMLREGTEPEFHEARQGVLVHQTQSGTQLIRVLTDNVHVYPEISTGRHRTTVRFMEYHDSDLSVRQCRSSVAFRMACCHL